MSACTETKRGINVHLRSARGIPSIVMRRGRPGIAPRQHLIERAAAVSFCPNNLAATGNEDPMQGGAAEARPPNDVTAAICGNVTLGPAGRITPFCTSSDGLVEVAMGTFIRGFAAHRPRVLQTPRAAATALTET
jgi:hypothetical protein